MALSNFFSDKEKRILEDYLGSEYTALEFPDCFRIVFIWGVSSVRAAENWSQDG